MIYAGLDFGTTNSALCFFDSEDYNEKRENYLRIDNSSQDFFPSVMIYSKNNPEKREIGRNARLLQISQNYDAYETFKLRLGSTEAQNNRTAKEVTKDYIQEVLARFEFYTHKKIDLLVHTVPETWIKNPDGEGPYAELVELYEQLGLQEGEHVVFESEPVAAAAYYCNRICDKQFYGHVIVVDYGGGTLDLTLCEVDQSGSIIPLDHFGTVMDAKNGNAGSAFDDQLAALLIKRENPNKEQYQYGKPHFYLFRNALEDAKIANTERTIAALKGYYQSEGVSDEVAFEVFDNTSLLSYEVHASDISEVFSKVNEKALREGIDTIKNHCRLRDINTNSQEHFRVLLVGGFSNLYCVESVVRKEFDSIDGIRDARFDERMYRESRSTAIAHGACLIAAGKTPIVHVTKYEVGIVIYDPEKEMEVLCPVIKISTPLSEYKEITYFPESFQLFGFRKDFHLRLYFKDFSSNIIVSLDKTLDEICPDSDDPENYYKIGLSLDRRQIPWLHVCDRSGKEYKECLEELLNKISIRIKQ